MKKLNENGFAFSTMLYGSVALIAAVLYVILNTNKASVDTTYYYGEEILQDLNDCVTEEIALENCYSSGNTNCNAAAYHACLGVSDSNEHDKGVIAAETLKGNVVTSGNGLYADQYVSKKYVYVGSNVNNYISFSGRLWRIVSIEPGGQLKILDINKYGDLAWDTQKGQEWGSSSTLYATLNGAYLSTISDSSKVVSNQWYKPYILPSKGATLNKLTLDELHIQEYNEEAGNSLVASVGLLYLSDYIYASNTCKSDVISAKECISWLSPYQGWSLDVNGEEGTSSEGKAYYFGSGKKNDENGVLNTVYNAPILDNTEKTHEVYPVIYLDRNSIISGGNGTQGNPYVLK